MSSPDVVSYRAAMHGVGSGDETPRAAIEVYCTNHRDRLMEYDVLNCNADCFGE